MLSRDQTIAAMNAIADQVEAHCAEHEREQHGGELCPGQRMGVVAFLAHRLGFSPATPEVLLEVVWNFGNQVIEYGRMCNGDTEEADDEAETDDS